MKAWSWMLGGLVVWAAHFLGLYALSSTADVIATADDALWRMAGLGFSMACIMLSTAILLVAVRRLRQPKSDIALFADQVAAAGAGVGIIAMVWQALPTVIGY